MARYALVIGISEYQSSNLSRLPKTVTDAEAVAQILKQYGDFQIVKRLPERWNQQNNDYEIGTKAVTGNELGQALTTFLLEQAYRSDALIYFSGHGITVSDNLGKTKGYLATSDCVLETDGKRIVGQQHGIALDSLNDLIRDAELSSLVLLLDCCHSGYFLERQLVEQTLTAFSSQKDYYVITACRTFEQAWAMHDEKHDVFTGAVLDGLALENAGKDGSVSGDLLFYHISRQLKGKRQEPIRMGWGKSITIVNYPLTENTLSATFNRENPYQGLQAFELEKEEYFFGRVQAIRALLDRLTNSRFLSVIGQSGCGKSSLVKAGLLPKLKRDYLPGSSQWEIEIFTPGKHPLGNLTEILTRRHQEDKPFVLFIDQFEEVFTLCNDEAERQSFMRLMADEATASDRITRVIVAIRGDFLDRCAAYPEAVNLINRTQPTTYVVELLSHSEIVETIEKPAELHGVGFEPGLVSRIAEDVENQPGALPLLQYALSELWRKFCEQDSPSGQPLLTWEDYEEIGGVKGALDNRATILYRSFIPENQAFVRRLFMTLVKLGDGNEVTRRRATWDDVRAIADSPEQLQQVVRLLAGQQQRLIITDENTIEVAHEALLSEWKLLRSWIEEDRDNIRLKQSLEDECREWLERFNKSDDALLTGARLAAIEEWVKNTQPRLPALEAEFFHKSVEKRDRQLNAELKRIEEQLEQEQKLRKAEKQRTSILLGSGFLIVFLLSFLWLAQILAKNKQIQTLKIGEINTLLVSSKTFLDSKDELNALIEGAKALEKLSKIDEKEYQKKSIAELQSIFVQIQERNRLENKVHGHKLSVTGISFSPNYQQQVIASASHDRTVKLWKTDGTFSKDLPPLHLEKIWSVNFSPDGQYIASASSDERVIIWDKYGNYIIALKGHVGDVNHATISPKNQVVASAGDDRTVRLWTINWKTKKLDKSMILKGHKEEVISVNFSRDGEYIVSASNDKTIRLWDKRGNYITSLTGHQDSVKFASFSYKNNEIISVGNDRKIISWQWKIDSKTNKVVKNSIKSKVIAQDINRSFKVSFSPNYQMIAAIDNSEESVIKLWKADGTELPSLKGHKAEINDFSFSPDSKIIATAGRDRSIKFWSSDFNSDNKSSVDLWTQYCEALQDYLNSSKNIHKKNICPMN